MNKKWLNENFNDEIRDSLFRIKVELPNGEVVMRDFSVDVDIDYDMLEEQLSETPSQYALLSNVLAEQKYIVSKIERLIARRRAVIAEKANETAKNENMKLHKYVLDELVEADAKILELQSRLMLEERTLSKLFGFVDAIRMKSEHLRSLSGFKKQELRNS